MQNQIRILELAFYYRQKLSHDDLKNQLTEKIKTVRNYIKASKGGAYDYLDHADCGRQDAFGDKVDQLFREFTALKIAYKMQRGDATLFKYYSDLMVNDL